MMLLFSIFPNIFDNERSDRKLRRFRWQLSSLRVFVLRQYYFPANRLSTVADNFTPFSPSHPPSHRKIANENIIVSLCNDGREKRPIDEFQFQLSFCHNICLAPTPLLNYNRVPSRHAFMIKLFWLFFQLTQPSPVLTYLFGWECVAKWHIRIDVFGAPFLSQKRLSPQNTQKVFLLKPQQWLVWH